ncbi:MAG TPA: c-type cytochrome biogenesis protein CcmI [Caulobacteraceae bacterium]|nr:c-type cytochrome biogenesis protein CcmI [Caulobacteraceae bacterium]
MIVLWIAAALLAAAAAALTGWRAARAGALGGPDPSVALYRRQLAEIDDLAARGLLAEGELKAARAETGRRLLAAADRNETAPGRRLGDRTILVLAAIPAFAALALYFVIGSPQLPDVPFQARYAQWRAHPERYGPQELGAALQRIAAERPTDPEPLIRLAALDLQLGDGDGAEKALRRAVIIAPGRADLLAPLGEVMVLKAGGDVGPEAQAVFQKALTLDPSSDTARYYLARGRILHGDVAGGLAEWRALAAALPAGDPRRAGLDQDIAAVVATGKPAPLPGTEAPKPQITPMIRQMVDGLAARLKANPDDPQGWVRLVRAYSVMGETDKRDAALAEARARYKDRPEVLSQLNAALAPAR